MVQASTLGGKDVCPVEQGEVVYAVIGDVSMARSAIPIGCEVRGYPLAYYGDRRLAQGGRGANRGWEPPFRQPSKVFQRGENPPLLTPADDFETMLQISEEVVTFIQQKADEENRKAS
jgi:hypothetical protein